MPTIYPERIDTDLEISRVDDDITEVGGDIINSLRDAVFAIESAVGVEPQGNKASFADRVNVSIDDNGNIKASALDGLGLLTLPILNKHIGSTAAIEESKLDLDFSTASLKNLIDSLRTDMTAALTSISSSAADFSLHILGGDHFHDGYHIKIDVEFGNGVAGLEAETIGDAINEFSTILLSGSDTITPHIDLNMPSSVKHRASEISVDTTNFELIDRTVLSVQQAFDSIDAAQGILGITHVDTFHANGIAKDINSGILFNENRLLLGPNSDALYTEGTSIIKIPGVVSFSALGITTGSILEIGLQAGIQDAGTYQIRAVGPLSGSDTLGDLPALAADELAVFHVFVESRESGAVTINVYEPASISSEGAPLACIVRNNQTIVDTISILPPDAARVVSVGFNSSVLNTDGYDIAIRVGIGQNNFREITIPNLNLERLGSNQAQPVDAGSVAERINAYVSDPTLGFNFPITSYKIGNELAIAHNLVGEDFTLEVMDGYSGNFAVGLDAYGASVAGRIIAGNTNNAYSVNGVSLSSLRTIFDGYAEITSSTDTFVLWTNEGVMINPLRLGIAQGSLIHITEHPTLDTNGSYTLFSANSTTVSVFGVEAIDAPTNPTTFKVFISDSSVPLSVLGGVETDQGVVELYVDSAGKVLTHQRFSYGTTLGSAIEFIDISNNFPLGNFTVNVDATVSDASFTLINDSLPGETVTVRIGFKGILKLFHPNNIDYILVKITFGTIIDGVEVISVKPPLNYDEAFQLCSLHFNGTLTITNTIDKRLFGNLSANQVRDDFIELFSQAPTADLRSDGVVRGFDVMDIPFVDSITQMGALPLRGGVAYVNGVRLTVETQKVIVPSYDEEGTILNNARRIIGINEFGSIRVFSDELGELLSDGYSPSVEFGKILPLYYVTINGGSIDDITDVRLFINSLDSKLELIVDESNNVVGNFRSLEGALLYASAYPHREHLAVRIINSVFPNGQVTVPSGVSIIGGAIWGGESKHQIVNTFNLGIPFLVLLGNNRLENVEVISELATTNGALVNVLGPNVNVENCLLRFGQDVSSVDADVGVLIDTTANKDVRIVNNKIDSIYAGVVSESGCNNLVIEGNVITNLAGTGGVSNGIKIGTTAREIDNVLITKNQIRVPSVVTPADIRGIFVDVGNAIDELRITNNSIIHTAFNTMTNGIRIENEAVTGETAARAFITDNLITGVSLDDNDVWGIYVSSVEDGKISSNIITDVGVSTGNTDVACIGVGANVDFCDISNNILRDCDVTRGIEITSGEQVAILNNSLRTLGAAAYYINGNSVNSSISGNTLVGPGLKGIRWTGTNSKISDNHLSQPEDATEYAFQEHAIYVQTSDVDIMNNTITGMVYDEGSIGITNVSLARDRMKIIGNTITGSLMSHAIELYSDGHSVCNNRILNDEDHSTGTVGIEMNEVSNALVMGNTVRGNLDTAIGASTSLDNVSISNNIIDTRDLAGGGLGIDSAFALDVAENCFISGNKILNSGIALSTMTNTIGSSTEASFGDSGNSIAANAGLLDMRNIHAAKATTSYDSASGDPLWAMKSTNNYWELFSGSSLTRNLYFTLDDLPNGAKIQSVQAHGAFNSQGTLTIQAFRKSRVDLASSNVSLSDTITTATFGIIGDGDGLVAATVNDAAGENVDHYGFNYYVTISHTGGAANPENIRIHGLTVIFRY